ncbi:MAG: PepSY-associated TM helix domain-containing protein [Verrucomicrobiota bacterium]
MKDTGFRNAMTWLHTWAGLLPGWVLFAIFVTGTATYFRPEITAWMQPEVPRRVSVPDAGQHALAHLAEVAPDSPRWLVSLPDARSSELKVFWQEPPARRFKSADIDPLHGTESTARKTYGGEFFYRFHFQLMLPHPWGRWLACIAAVFMLVALISGVATHRRLLADMFLFRRTRDGRRPWLDFHNVTAVLALPFYVLIAYSALVVFNYMYMPWARFALDSVDAKPAKAVAASGNDTDAAPVDMVSPEEIFRTTATLWGGERSVRRIDIADRGTADAVITLTRADGPAVSLHSRDTLKFSAVTGEPIQEADAVGPGRAALGWLYGFHLARFADPVLRTLFFIMGAMGTAMTGTGLALWTLKRRDKLCSAGRGGRFGYWLVSRLNVAFITGLPVACAAYFWANRLVPAGVAGRDQWEINAVLIIWAATALHAFVRPERAGWREQFVAGAVAFGGLPLLDLATGGRFDGLHAGFSLVFFALAAFCVFGARRLCKPSAA